MYKHAIDVNCFDFASYLEDFLYGIISLQNKLINSFTHTVVFPSCRQTGETVVMGGSLLALKVGRSKPGL